MLNLPQEPPVSDTQDDYFLLWNQFLGERVFANPSSASAKLSPTELADYGGRLADRAAWVFIAGYQGALRQCFPVLGGHSGWASYVVSEARDESGTATCELLNEGAQSYLQGTKNWIAASKHLSWLVVNATSTNVLIAADASGAELIEKPSGRFLPELIVARAEFSRVALDADSKIEDADSFVSHFGLIEARCLLVALAGHFSQVAPDAAQPTQSLMLASGLATAELATKASIDVLLESMALLVEWFEGWHDQDSGHESPAIAKLRQRWSQDQRLLQMHRPLLIKQQQRLA